MELHDVYSFDGAAGILFKLCKERRDENIVNISFQMPTWEKHLEFIKSHPYVYWYLIFEGHYHGYVSLTYQNEIGIVLFKKSRGQGIGKQALELFMWEHAPLPAVPSQRRGCFVANINPENERSIKLFTGLGFHHVQNTYTKS